MRAAITRIPAGAWIPAENQDGECRENGGVAELTGLLDLDSWPEGSRVIVRREHPHPGAQLSFTDEDGHRFQAILTDQTSPDIQMLECRHRARARVENQNADMKDTGLSNRPVRRCASHPT